MAFGITGGIRCTKGLSGTQSEVTLPAPVFEDEFDGNELGSAKLERCRETEHSDGMFFFDKLPSSLSGDGRLLLIAEWPTA